MSTSASLQRQVTVGRLNLSVPRSWDVRTLGEICRTQSGGTPSRLRLDYYQGSIPWAKIEDLTFARGRLTRSEEHVTEEAIDNSSARIFPPQTVLLAMYASIGEAAIAEIATSSNQAIIGCQCGPLVLPEFLLRWLTLIRPELPALGRGGTQANINAGIVKALPVPLPPVSEQKRIAALLREQLGAAARMRAAAAGQVRVAEASMAAEFVAAFDALETRGLPIRRLGDVCHIQLGKMLSPASKTGTRSRSYLRNANVQWDRFDLSEIHEMDFSEREEKKFLLRAGGVLVCEGGEPGRAAVWSGEIDRCCYQKALHRLRPNGNSVDPHFVAYRLWAGATRGEFSGSHAKTTIAHLPAVRLAELRIALPSLSEQVEIATALRERASWLSRLLSQLNDELDLIGQLPAALLRSAFAAGSPDN